MRIAGLLLAAGAGRRWGEPKALVRDEHGPWLLQAVSALAEGGCDTLTVVVGAAVVGPTEMLREEHADEVQIVVAHDWSEGMGASLRAGLAALDADVAVVSLVDVPDVGGDVVRRLLDAPVDAGTLRRATYLGEPGHPVVIGRAHWSGIIAVATGDRGARDYLAEHPAELVECGDLATGVDRDVPP